MSDDMFVTHYHINMIIPSWYVQIHDLRYRRAKIIIFKWAIPGLSFFFRLKFTFDSKQMFDIKVCR